MLARLSRRLRNLLGPRRLTRRLRPAARRDLERLGSAYGGWVIPATLLSTDSVCYCAGVGEDITFDLELIARYDCHVYAFDPTPRAIAFVARTAAGNPRYHFMPVGLWSRDENRRFHAPRDPRHVSHSIVNLQNTRESFEAPCRRLSSLMREHGHQRLDLLKLDIEGAEHEVLRSVIDDRLAVRVLCVEFDQPCTDERIIDMAGALSRAGYELVHIDGWNYTFVADAAPR